MSKKRNSISDLRGAGRLAVDAVNGVIDIVEAMHYNISNFGGLLAKKGRKRTSGISGLVYRRIRSITGLAGKSFDVLMDRLSVIVNEKEPNSEQGAILAALNGVIGDHLAETNNPLAIPMQLRRNGEPITSSMQLVDDRPIKNMVLLIHGSCMNDRQWSRLGHNHAAALEADLGYKPVYLHYNSGKHISENGKELSDKLEHFFNRTAEEYVLTILAHSMGGLVARSACYYGKERGHQWLSYLKKLIFLGTPHHGAPMEQTGNWIDNMLEFNAYSRPISRLGKIRSAGITDLRYGNILDEDWKNRDRFERTGDQRIPVPLPAEVQCYAVAARIVETSSKFGDDLIGDGLVPLYSALGRHTNPALNLTIPKENQWIGRKLKHLDLLSHKEVYTTIKKWM